MPWILFGVFLLALSEVGESANIVRGRYRHERPMDPGELPPLEPIDNYWRL